MKLLKYNDGRSAIVILPIEVVRGLGWEFGIELDHKIININTIQISKIDKTTL